MFISPSWTKGTSGCKARTVIITIAAEYVSFFSITKIYNALLLGWEENSREGDYAIPFRAQKKER